MTPAPSARVSAGRRSLESLLDAELRRSPPDDLAPLLRQLLNGPGAEHIVGILFYGSTLRAGSTRGGMADLYCLVDGNRAFYGERLLLGWAGVLLPPNVSHLRTGSAPESLRGKVAVMSLAQFRWAARHGVGMSIWARFCQPAILCHARDPAAAAAIRDAVADAATMAVRWAVRLRGAAASTPHRLWSDLFRFTYGAELRAEGSARAALIHDHDPARYARVLAAASQADGIAYAETGAGLEPAAPPLSAGRRAMTRAGWTAVGKTLSILRLVKAGFTFEGGADYLSWKIERHAGTRLELSAWQRRHPVLAGPFVAWRLWRRGVLK